MFYRFPHRLYIIHCTYILVRCVAYDKCFPFPFSFSCSMLNAQWLVLIPSHHITRHKISKVTLTLSLWIGLLCFGLVSFSFSHDGSEAVCCESLFCPCTLYFIHNEEKIVKVNPESQTL